MFMLPYLLHIAYILEDTVIYGFWMKQWDKADEFKLNRWTFKSLSYVR